MFNKSAPPLQQTDVVLDPSIRYSQNADNIGDPKAILITGATGLLGANLLAELLTRTTADLFCIVRAESVALGRARIREQLKFFQYWKPIYNDRIKPVLGNLEKPQLGLSDQSFNMLAETIDVIYHCAANTSLVLPYDRLYGANVAGTKCLLTLAGLHKTKPFHYVSTISVLSRKDEKGKVLKVILEKQEPANSYEELGGYAATKAVSERLIRLAIERGLPASIYRIGRIMGHSQNGRINSSLNLPMVMWKAATVLGLYPNVNKEWNFVPADFAGRAIAHLSFQPDLFGETFHVINSYSIAWSSIFQIIQEYGYPLESTSLRDWIDETENKSIASHWNGENADIEISLLHSGAKGFFSPGNQTISNYNFLEALKNSLLECPPIDDKLIRLYLRWLERTDFLPPPPSDVVAKWRRRSAAKS